MTTEQSQSNNSPNPIPALESVTETGDPVKPVIVSTTAQTSSNSTKPKKRLPGIVVALAIVAAIAGGYWLYTKYIKK